MPTSSKMPDDDSGTVVDYLLYDHSLQVDSPKKTTMIVLQAYHDIESLQARYTSTSPSSTQFRKDIIKKYGLPRPSSGACMGPGGCRRNKPYGGYYNGGGGGGGRSTGGGFHLAGGAAPGGVPPFVLRNHT